MVLRSAYFVLINNLAANNEMKYLEDLTREQKLAFSKFKKFNNSVQLVLPKVATSEKESLLK